MSAKHTYLREFAYTVRGEGGGPDKQVTATLKIDVEALARKLTNRALNSKARKSTALEGAVLLEVRQDP